MKTNFFLNFHLGDRERPKPSLIRKKYDDGAEKYQCLFDSLGRGAIVPPKAITDILEE